MADTYEFHVLEEDFLCPIKVAVFGNLDDAENFVRLFAPEHKGKLYIVQRLARFSYR